MNTEIEANKVGFYFFVHSSLLYSPASTNDVLKSAAVFHPAGEISPVAIHYCWVSHLRFPCPGHLPRSRWHEGRPARCQNEARAGEPLRHEASPCEARCGSLTLCQPSRRQPPQVAGGKQGSHTTALHNHAGVWRCDTLVLRVPQLPCPNFCLPCPLCVRARDSTAHAYSCSTPANHSRPQSAFLRRTQERKFGQNKHIGPP